jgi:hypothetical protein
MDLKSGEYSLVIDNAIAPWILDDGHLVYSQGGGLVGQLVVRPFDFETMEPYGLPAPFSVHPLDWTKWAISKDGTVVYTGESVAGKNVETWIGLDGSRQGNLSIPDGQYVRMQFSPTGDRLAAVRLNDQTYGDAWVIDVEGIRAPTRLTQTPGGRAIAWARDGSTIYFGDTGQSGTTSTLLSIRADGGGAMDTVKTFVNREIDWLNALPDGNRLLFYDRIGNDLFLYSLADDALEPVTDSRSEEELSPSVSPDGRFVAYYDVDQPGSRILVRELGGSGRWEISETRLSMRNPVWSTDGRYLFFSTTTGQLYRHRITLSPTFSPIGQPELIADFAGSIPVVAVHPDGKRLLVSSSLVLADRDQSLNFIFNFTEEAKRIAPTQ